MDLLIAAVTREDVANYVRTLAYVYVIIIFIRIIFSWFDRMPYNRWLSAVVTFVSDVTDPYLNVFRRILPPIRIGPGALDLSPMVASFALLAVALIVASLIQG